VYPMLALRANPSDDCYTVYGHPWTREQHGRTRPSFNATKPRHAFNLAAMHWGLTAIYANPPMSEKQSGNKKKGGKLKPKPQGITSPPASDGDEHRHALDSATHSTMSASTAEQDLCPSIWLIDSGQEHLYGNTRAQQLPCQPHRRSSRGGSSWPR
jgi:hypothetical protein